MLPDQGMRLYSTIRVYLRHINVINEVDQVFSAWRSKISTSFLLQRLLHDLLEHERVGIIVQGYGGNQSLVGVQTSNLIIDKYGLATASIPHQHDRMTVCHQQVHKVAEANSLSIMDQCSLECVNYACVLYVCACVWEGVIYIYIYIYADHKIRLLNRYLEIKHLVLLSIIMYILIVHFSLSIMSHL